MSDVQLDNYININMYDGSIREHTFKLIYSKRNSMLYDFDACDSDTLGVNYGI